MRPFKMKTPLGTTATTLYIATAISASKIATAKTITRDVVIVGGGASGAYSAVRLREDFGVSILLIEKGDRLGGHVNTWTDPSTNRSFDAGVQSYIDIPADAANGIPNIGKPFFHRLNISTSSMARSSNRAINVDFVTGTVLTNYSSPASTDRTEALRRYLSVCEKYLPVMEPGWWNFPSPSQKAGGIPEDLLLPFGEFVSRYNLTSALPQILGTTGLGINNVLETQTMWVMRSFNAHMTRSILGDPITSGFGPTSRRNQDLYDNIYRLLGPADVHLSSTVVRTPQRTSSGVILKIKNHKTGEITEVKAKRLLYTIAPTDENLHPFDPDSVESNIFKRWRYSTAFVGIVSHPSLPRETALVNTPVAADNNSWALSVPAAPFVGRFDNYNSSGYFRIIIGGPGYLFPAGAAGLIKAKKVVTDSFAKLVNSGVLKQTDPPQELRFHMFEPHGRMNAYVKREELEEGFFDKLNGLQGRRGTWYNGAAWTVHVSTNLWVFSETLLPRLVDDLKKSL